MPKFLKIPVLSRKEFSRRLLRHSIIGAIFILVALVIGILGYHGFEDLSWLDSLLNASMILGGMGPVDLMHTVGGKLFASFYAIFSGVVFLAVTGIVFAPVAHRLLQKFHLDEDDKEQ